MGKKEFIKHARWMRKSIGGGLRQSGVLTAAARVAVDETFGTGPNGEGGVLKKSHETARRLADLWTSLGGKLASDTETNMVWLDLDSAGLLSDEFIALGKKHGLRLGGGRLVVHYQIAQEAVTKMEQVLRAAMKKE